MAMRAVLLRRAGAGDSLGTNMAPETLPLLLLAAFFTARCAYYRSQPSWKWLLPGATVVLALLPESTPVGLVIAVALIGLVAAVGHLRWALGRSGDSGFRSR